MQTPAPFEYERATSVEGAIAALERLGPEARVIAGGHSLLPMMKLRLASPEHLIDINELARARLHPRAGRRDPDRRADPPRRPAGVRRCWRATSRCSRDAENVIADPVVRNRGTIGGSLCQADAAEDLSAVCSAAKAQVVIRGGDGERVVGMEDFHVGPYTTAVGAGEMLTEVRLPVRPGAGSAHEKVERRAGDWAIAAASAALWIDGRHDRRRRRRAERGRHDHRSTSPGPRSCCAARRRRRSCSPRPARSPPRTARRAPTAAGRSTTSATSPACSPNARCAARRRAPCNRRPDDGSVDDRQRRAGLRATSSRACCSCTSSARRST